jgi:hypothetical protein
MEDFPVSIGMAGMLHTTYRQQSIQLWNGPKFIVLQICDTRSKAVAMLSGSVEFLFARIKSYF